MSSCRATNGNREPVAWRSLTAHAVLAANREPERLDYATHEALAERARVRWVLRLVAVGAVVLLFTLALNSN